MTRACLWLLVLSGCAAPLASLSAAGPVTIPAGQLVLKSAPGQEADRDAVAVALQEAGPALARWGNFTTPVKLYLMPTHAMLESAVHREGYGWLRAWARYDEVFLQTPSTWLSPAGKWGLDAELEQLLTHELTHCLMYQHAATASDWARKKIPVWFREGMATWTAGQGERFITLEELARFMDAHPNEDPVLDADAMYQRHSEIVYSAAHLAFSFLMRRYSEEQLNRQLALMAAGRSFAEAFATAFGISEASFVGEFRRYVLWRAFRGIGASLH